MPWSPSFDSAVPDPRLDPYRSRAAQLVDDGEVVGHVLVETDYSSDILGGVLWWRRWAEPVEVALVLTRLGDAEPTTAGIGPENLDLFARWATDGYAEAGRRLVVEWLDDSASARVHDEVFGHQH